jgi:hypothetical protein
MSVALVTCFTTIRILSFSIFSHSTHHLGVARCEHTVFKRADEAYHISASFASRFNKAAPAEGISRELGRMTCLMGSVLDVNRIGRPEKCSDVMQESVPRSPRKSTKKPSAHFRFRELQILHRNVNAVYPTHKMSRLRSHITGIHERT